MTEKNWEKGKKKKEKRKLKFEHLYYWFHFEGCEKELSITLE